MHKECYHCVRWPDVGKDFVEVFFFLGGGSKSIHFSNQKTDLTICADVKITAILDFSKRPPKF